MALIELIRVKDTPNAETVAEADRLLIDGAEGTRSIGVEFLIAALMEMVGGTQGANSRQKNGNKLQIINIDSGSFHDIFFTGVYPALQLNFGPPDDSQIDLSEIVATSDARLKEIVSSRGYEVLEDDVDDDGVTITATIKWPDGSAGTFTVTEKNTTFLDYDAFTVTHEDSGKTVTQAAMTRNALGKVISKPALTVA